MTVETIHINKGDSCAFVGDVVQVSPEEKLSAICVEQKAINERREKRQLSVVSSSQVNGPDVGVRVSPKRCPVKRPVMQENTRGDRLDRFYGKVLEPRIVTATALIAAGFLTLGLILTHIGDDKDFTYSASDARKALRDARVGLMVEEKVQDRLWNGPEVMSQRHLEAFYQIQSATVWINSSLGSCTGVVVNHCDKKAVITARHCLEEDGKTAENFVFGRSGDPLDVYIPQVKRVELEDENTDIGVIFLEDSDDFPFSAVEIYSDIRLEKGSEILLSSFGAEHCQRGMCPHTEVGSVGSVGSRNGANTIYINDVLVSGRDSGGGAFVMGEDGMVRLVGIVFETDLWGVQTSAVSIDEMTILGDQVPCLQTEQ